MRSLLLAATLCLCMAAGPWGEDPDQDVPPTHALRLTDQDGPTPTHIVGARVLGTVRLRDVLAAGERPLLIDVSGEPGATIPTAIWMPDAGGGRHMEDDIQAWLDYYLARFTNRDKSWPVVVFCENPRCWQAHNAVVRIIDLGYRYVYWYRGGVNAWRDAGLRLVPGGPEIR